MSTEIKPKFDPFQVNVYLYTAWKRQKTRGFLTFSGGIEKYTG